MAQDRDDDPLLKKHFDDGLESSTRFEFFVLTFGCVIVDSKLLRVLLGSLLVVRSDIALQDAGIPQPLTNLGLGKLLRVLEDHECLRPVCKHQRGSLGWGRKPVAGRHCSSESGISSSRAPAKRTHSRAAWATDSSSASCRSLPSSRTESSRPLARQRATAS